MDKGPPGGKEDAGRWGERGSCARRELYYYYYTEKGGKAYRVGSEGARLYHLVVHSASSLHFPLSPLELKINYDDDGNDDDTLGGKLS